LSSDLPRSRTLLQQRMAIFERPGDQQLWPAWVAALDLAWTLALANDTSAQAALQAAAARRPPGIAAGHPLDVVQAYLQAYLEAYLEADTQAHSQANPQAGPGVMRSRSANPAAAEKVQRIGQALRQLQGRRLDAPPGPGLGSFAGAFN
jgi:hypothetical protein